MNTQPSREGKTLAAVNKWNARYPVGTLCRFWRGVRGEGEPTISRTKCFAQVLCGTAVVWFECGGGAIALTHIEAIEESEGAK